MCMAAQAELERLNGKDLLPLMLADKTSGKNIIWATDAYESLGPGYKNTDSITPKLLLKEPFTLMNRADKAKTEQSRRTRTHAEVFTPFWVVKKMNDYIDADWFGRDNPFCSDRVAFPGGKDWRKYVDSRRLEITCGEAPYLVTRYDVTTGENIAVQERAGILDRKLRIVNENASDENEWLFWVFRAFEATYGYEFQGDNVLLARLNLILTFEEYLRERFGREPSRDEYQKLIRIVTWNLWQMDGLNGLVPYSEAPEEYEQLTLDFGNDESEEKCIVRACRVFDWRAKCSVAYNELKRRDAA